jgi:hypothetical protein
MFERGEPLLYRSIGRAQRSDLSAQAIHLSDFLLKLSRALFQRFVGGKVNPGNIEQANILLVNSEIELPVKIFGERTEVTNAASLSDIVPGIHRYLAQSGQEVFAADGPEILFERPR